VNNAAAWAMIVRLGICMALILCTLLFMLWWGTRPPR